MARLKGNYSNNAVKAGYKLVNKEQTVGQIIRTLYTGEMRYSLRELTELFIGDKGLMTRLGISSRHLLKQSLGFALAGYQENNGHFNYTGLISVEEYLSIAGRNSQGAGGYGGANCILLGRGLAGLNLEARTEGAKAAVAARGDHSWGDEESTFLLQHYTRRNARELTDRINNTFHGGKKVRTPNSVKLQASKLTRQRNQAN